VSNTADRIVRRLGSMKADRAKHEHTWVECLNHTNPELADGLGGQVVDSNQSQTRKAESLDSVASDGARLLASGVMGGMTPANSVWFAMDVGDETDEERRWLDHSAEMMWEAIHGSNFDAEAYEGLLCLMGAGWFVLFIEERAGRLHFQLYPLSQCYLASSISGGPVDTLYRCFSLTAEQAVAEYGDEVSDKVRQDAAEKPDTPHQFIQAIYPRTEYTPGSKLPRNMPIASVHVEMASKKLVRESGYNEQPFVAPRWMRIPNTAYATGPVSNALATIKELNELLSMEKIALARAAAGVYVAEDDGVLNPRNVRVRGGSVIVANSINSIKELGTGADFNVTFSKADQLRAEIRRILMADQLQPQDGPAMTATEVHVRVALIRQLLGPLYGRLQSEYLSPLVERVFGLLYRRGRPELGGDAGDVLIDDAPESLLEEKLRIRYQSPLARAQKLEDVTAIERVVGIAGAMAAAGMPEAMDLIDREEALRLAADGLGTPAKVLRDEKALTAYRDQRAQAQEQQAQAAQQQQIQTMAAEAAMSRAAA
jgi:hypothetical protein